MSQNHSTCPTISTVGMRLSAVHLVLICHSVVTADTTPHPEPTHVQEADGHAVPSPDGRFVAVSGLHLFPYVEPVPARSVGDQRELEVSCGKRVGTLVFSPDARWIAGLGTDKADRDYAFVWSAEKYDLICECALPESATVATSIRFSPASDVLYIGARNEVYKCDVRRESLTSVVSDARYYVQDLAITPGEETLAFCDRVTPFGLRRWSLIQREELPSFFDDKQEAEVGRDFAKFGTSVDFSRDGTEMAVAVGSGGSPKLSFIYRFDTSTGAELSRAVIANRSIKKVRYVGRTKVLIVAGSTGGVTRSGGFGMMGPITEDPVDWFELGMPPTGISTDSPEDGHITVGLPKKVLRWDSSRWPERWTSLFH